VLGGGGLSDSSRAQRTERGGRGRLLTLGQLVIFGIVGILFLILLATNPGLAIYLVASILSGNRDGSYRGGGGGGGFSGGGGRSGGGGASGSW